MEPQFSRQYVLVTQSRIHKVLERPHIWLQASQPSMFKPFHRCTAVTRFNSCSNECIEGRHCQVDTCITCFLEPVLCTPQVLAFCGSIYHGRIDELIVRHISLHSFLKPELCGFNIAHPASSIDEGCEHHRVWLDSSLLRSVEPAFCHGQVASRCSRVYEYAVGEKVMLDTQSGGLLEELLGQQQVTTLNCSAHDGRYFTGFELVTCSVGPFNPHPGIFQFPSLGGHTNDCVVARLVEFRAGIEDLPKPVLRLLQVVCCGCHSGQVEKNSVCNNGAKLKGFFAVT
mmetsp:Transcript_60131/g.119300  ORF Transcript_60131/g.119300 Transcript_60131/m.119300 type:complete len:285 (+) Transcript_60131:442-1296(+)